jgi:cellulose synthase/poly-beta-1,6-N-acetylglucosamine synthase-like glycosyltransferase
MTVPDSSASASGAPLVSVVMPVRNESASIRAAIASVLEQTVSAIELLVVDGDSSDDTADQIRAVAAADPRVKLLHNPQRTIPHALNVGLSQARAAVLARVDAHARVNPGYLEAGLAELTANPDVAAVGGRRIGVARTRTGRAVAAALSSRFGVGNSVNHYGDVLQDTDHASFGVYRTSVLRDVGGWDERLLVNEDVDIDYRILALGHRIRFDPQMCIYWQVRETLRDFGRQYRRYGRGKAAMVRKNGPGAIRPRHLAAPGLVGVLGVAGVLAASGRPKGAAALVAPYGTGIVAATTVVSTDGSAAAGEEPWPPALAAAFVVMHVSWGLGFLEGLVFGLPPVASSAR